MTYPTDEQVQELDEELASDGIAVRDRPGFASMRWLGSHGATFDGLMKLERWMETKFGELHPSVDFAERPYMLLCVSARGVPYKLNPPVVFASVVFNPIDHVVIRPEELARLRRQSEDDYWDLHYQAADGIDLVTSRLHAVRLPPEAQEMIAVGYSNFESLARLVLPGSPADAGLAHAMCVAVETITKGVLAGSGLTEPELKKLSHDIPAMCSAVADRYPGPRDGEFKLVAKSMPPFVSSRYKPARLQPVEAQDLYRRTLFLCAEALRRTNDPDLTQPLYRFVAENLNAPKRCW